MIPKLSKCCLNGPQTVQRSPDGLTVPRHSAVITVNNVGVIMWDGSKRILDESYTFLESNKKKFIYFIIHFMRSNTKLLALTGLFIFFRNFSKVITKSTLCKNEILILVRKKIAIKIFQKNFVLLGSGC